MDFIPNSVAFFAVSSAGNVFCSFGMLTAARNFTIFARTVKFKNIYKGYSEAIDFSLPKNKRDEDGKKLALFNSANHLELAVYKSNPQTVGGASSLFGLDYRDPVTIKFE